MPPSLSPRRCCRLGSVLGSGLWADYRSRLPATAHLKHRISNHGVTLGRKYPVTHISRKKIASRMFVLVTWSKSWEQSWIWAVICWVYSCWWTQPSTTHPPTVFSISACTWNPTKCCRSNRKGECRLESAELQHENWAKRHRWLLFTADLCWDVHPCMWEGMETLDEARTRNTPRCQWRG